MNEELYQIVLEFYREISDFSENILVIGKHNELSNNDIIS